MGPPDKEKIIHYRAIRCEEDESARMCEELARSLRIPGSLVREVSRALVDFGWVKETEQGRMHLTEVGEARARELIRMHRIWERYLVDRERMPLDEVHAEAHCREHETTPEELERLDAELGHPAWDPHGHPIPAPGYRVPSPPGQPLLKEGTPGNRLRIVCIDDEPAPLLAQLVVMGLRPGVDVTVLDIVDASSLERNLNLALQILELTGRVVVALNRVLGNIPRGTPFEQTAIGWLVRGMAPLGLILGLSGEMLTALLFALPAKEIVMPALAVTYGLQTTLVESEQVLNHLARMWTPLISYTFLVFFMFYLPCLVTVWATWKETLSVRWTLTSPLVSLLTASAMTDLVYQGGRLLGFS